MSAESHERAQQLITKAQVEGIRRLDIIEVQRQEKHSPRANTG